MSRQHDLFDDQWTPLKVGFWCQPHHWAALVEGMSADEAEALRAEYSMCRAGHADALGRPCLCGDKTINWPAAVSGGSNRHGDSLASIWSLVADLKRAADELPIRWRETERVFIIQERGDEWRTRMGLANTGRKIREHDRMPDLGRQHAYAIMAWHLGWRGVVRWPRRDLTQLRAPTVLLNAA